MVIPCAGGKVAAHPSIKHWAPALLLSLHSCTLAGQEGGFYGVFCLKHLEKKEFVLGHLPDLHLGPGKSASHTFINKVLVYKKMK